MGSVVADVFRWGGGSLQLLDYCELTETTLTAADSWLVTSGTSLALDLHRSRFLAAAPGGEEFWDAAIAAIPTEGDWFPRVEQHSDGRFIFRLRSAPEMRRSLTFITHQGADPRRAPAVKGPDLDAMRRLRSEAQTAGADEAVILTGDGYVVESSQSAIAWWRGSILCTPPAEFARCDSVTARSLLGLAQALGVDLLEEAVTPAELDGTEIWALNALHGPRIVTAWRDGPQSAELPGRLTLWRDRLARLRHPLPVPA
jgi:branched-subunit amino acid aminotransferase/4-amino-4-deoxychorismate lyase